MRGWREDTIFLGRISTAFQVKIYSQRSLGLRGDVAIDHMEFLDCALPCEYLIMCCLSHYKRKSFSDIGLLMSKIQLQLSLMSCDLIEFVHHNNLITLILSVPLAGAECPAGTIECNREGCVELREICDFTDDCGDRTDEDNCGEESNVF